MREGKGSTIGRMDEGSRNLQRVNLWLRAEKAFGLDAVVRPRGNAEPPVEPAAVERSSNEIPAEKAGIAVENPPALWDRPVVSLPVLSTADKTAQLARMDADEVKNCRLCQLSKTRKQTVFGEGNPDAKIFFIGEGPGENEDLQGRPFVGRAGDLLNKMIAGMGLNREDVFIGNIVKCRPPGNRQPAPDEVETCTPYLVRQLEIIRPRVIVTLGLPSAKYMLNSNLSMGKMRGQWHNWRGIRLMPTYHPAFLLRAYTQGNRAAVWSDLKQVMSEIGLTPPGKTGPD